MSAGSITLTLGTTPQVPTSGKLRFFIDIADNAFKSIDENGTIIPYTPRTVEALQDIVGDLIVAASDTIIVSYDDNGNILSIDVDSTTIDHQMLLGAGVKTHAQIDSHIADINNPHGTTKAQVGLGSADNTSDLNKPISTATQSALDGKEPSITPGTTSQYLRGDKTWQTLDKAALGLDSVDNTSDLDKPISTATQVALDGKVDENADITPGTALKITYDAKGLITSGDSAELNDLSDINISNPAVDQVLMWNGAAWVNGQATTVNAGAGVGYFLSATASGIGGYDTMSKTPDVSTEVDESVSSYNDTVLIDGYINDTIIGGSQIDPGIWEFNFYSYASSALGSATIKIEMYKRTSGGTETLLFDAQDGDINWTTIDLLTIQTVQPAFACNTTDKLLIKIYAVTSGLLVPVTVHLVHSGTSHYSHFHTPLATRHNDLAGLQGGTAGEQYHLTQSEYVGTGSGSFVRKVSPDLTGTPTAPTAIASTSTTQIATTAYVKSQLTNTPPPIAALNHVAYAGTSSEFARADHIHHADNSGVTPGTYGSVSQIPQIIVNEKGQVTSSTDLSIAIPASQITDFAEAAQDVVGALLADSTTIDYTYNDVSNTLTTSVIPGGVDHNALLNGGGNKHIDHSAVTISAGTGLTGGGDITASRTLSIANTGVTAGTYGSVSKNQAYTVNAQGQITATSEYNIIDAPLTGIDTTTQGDVAATDSIVQAIGKIVANMNVWNELINTSDIVSNTNLVLSNITDLSFPVFAGKSYLIEVTVKFRSAATGTGIAVTLGTPDGATGSVACIANIPVAADGTSALYSGHITSLGDIVQGTGVQASNTNYIAKIQGVFICTGDGTLIPQFRSETFGTNVTFSTGSIILVREF